MTIGRRRCARASRSAALALPFALAFFSGGYFDLPRVWAGVVVWALLGVALARRSTRIGTSRAMSLALGGAAGLAAWTFASVTWAPVPDTAYRSGQIVLLYLGALALSAVVCSREGSARDAEPLLAAGALAVVGYGLGERLLPGLLRYAHSVSAQGRLEQPLTYWNAMGEMAALGFVLMTRLAGDERRGNVARGLAAAGSVPLALGVYLSFSRGALFACAAGLLTLPLVSRSRLQLRAAVITLTAGIAVVLLSTALPRLSVLTGSLGPRERDGAIALLGLAAVGAAAFVVVSRMRPGTQPLPLPRRAGLIAGLLLAVGLALAISVGAHERSGRALSPGAGRYVTLESNRYAYWRVALDDFAAQPLRGVGAGGWAVTWLQERRISEYAVDAHSLPLQTMAELGLVGLGLLLGCLGGVSLAARRAWRASPARAAGPIAVCVTWLVHQPLDWDWQMPALTLVAIVAAGLLLSSGADGQQVLATRVAPQA